MYISAVVQDNYRQSQTMLFLPPPQARLATLMWGALPDKAKCADSGRSRLPAVLRCNAETLQQWLDGTQCEPNHVFIGYSFSGRSPAAVRKSSTSYAQILLSHTLTISSHFRSLPPSEYRVNLGSREQLCAHQ